LDTFAIGIDIGGTRTKIGLVDLGSGRVDAMLVTPTETRDGERFLSGLGEAIQVFKDRVAARSGTLAGVGMGVPGFVFADGTVDSTYGFLEFMEDYPLARLMQDRYGLPCRLDNDARMVALGEAVYGKGRGYSRVLTLTLGTGLGLGFTIDGQLDGSLPYAHMGGHLTITTDDTVCYCGKTGCLESLVSGAGLTRLAGRFHWSEHYPDLPPTAEVIFAQRQAGNPHAQAIMEQYRKYLRTGIDNYISLFAPDRIVLGGGISKALANEVDQLHSPQFLNAFKAYKTSVVVSSLEEKAGILGAAALFN